MHGCLETEKRKRINVALWAYAYEIMDDPMVTDEMFDRVCGEIRPEIETGHGTLDAFFREEFNPSTGMWIHKHPEWQGLASIYTRLTGKPSRAISKNDSPPVTANISNMGFKTQAEMKLYLANLGFRVIPDMQIINGRAVSVDYDKDCAHLTCIATGEQRTIFYSELFTNA